jgi:hypothetical protein
MTELNDAEFQAEVARRKAAGIYEHGESAPLPYATGPATSSPPPVYPYPNNPSQTAPNVPGILSAADQADQAELTRLTVLQTRLTEIGGTLSPADQVSLTKLQTKSTASKTVRPDKYYAVKTGDTLDSIAKELGHEGEGQALFDHAHDGGVSNGEQIANHDNLIRGADGNAIDGRGALVPVINKDQVTGKTKLVEGMALLLPKGW